MISGISKNTLPCSLLSKVPSKVLGTCMCVPTSTNTGVVESLKERQRSRTKIFLDFGRRHPIIETDVPLIRLPAPAAAIPSTHREAPRLATDRREREGLERALARDVARAPLAQLMRQHGRCERPSIFRRRDATPRWNPPPIASRDRGEAPNRRLLLAHSTRDPRVSKQHVLEAEGRFLSARPRRKRPHVSRRPAHA